MRRRRTCGIALTVTLAALVVTACHSGGAETTFDPVRSGGVRPQWVDHLDERVQSVPPESLPPDGRLATPTQWPPSNTSWRHGYVTRSDAATRKARVADEPPVGHPGPDRPETTGGTATLISSA